MRVFASGLFRTVKLGLAPCFVLGLLVGCGSESGPGVAEPPKDSQAVTKVAPLTPAEKKKAKGATRTAAGTQPAGAQ